MQTMARRTAILITTLWVVALWAGPAAVVRADDAQDSTLLQPQALNWAGIYRLRQIDPNLTGADVNVALVARSYTYNDAGEPQNDYQPNIGHNCFRTARLSFLDEKTATPGISPHATAICSILFGQDPEGLASDLDPFVYEGALPAAEGLIYEFQHFLIQHVSPQTAPDADVVTASFGWPFDEWWTRGIEALIEHSGMVFVSSIGNGSNASDTPLYPGAGPNAIGVGVVSSVNAADSATQLAQFALAYPEESSTGPTGDGRCKPDLIAPGNCLVAGTEADEGYAMAGNWSSFSTPVAAGVVGLLVQAARLDPVLEMAASPESGNRFLKAILMSSATKLPYWHKGRLSPEDDHESPLDYVQGAGMIDAVGAHRLLHAGRGEPGEVPAAGWDLNEVDLERNLQQVYRFTVDEPEGKVLASTLVWNRHYSNEYPFHRLTAADSDLRLEVWAVDPTDPDKDVLLDYSDSRIDNVEHVYIETLPEFTVYEIVVTYSSVDGRAGITAGEQYGLAWNAHEKLTEQSIFWHDLNADGIVNEQDLAILMNNWAAGLKSSETYVFGDINGDGTIDDKDVQAMMAQHNRRADWHTAPATATN